MGLFKSKNKKIIESKMMDKLREEELDRAILNPGFNSEELRARMEKPVNVKYLTSAKRDSKNCMVHIQEVGELSTKDYLLNPTGIISIGAGKENTIVLNDLSVGSIKCEIVNKGTALGARSNDYNKNVRIKRGGKSVFLGNEMIEIRSGDEISLGKTLLKIVLM